MAISSTVSRNQYLGNGAVSIYSYSFRILAASDLLVTVRSPSGGETTLALGVDYTVSGVGALNGGNVTLVDIDQSWLNTGGNLASGYTLTIRRVRPITQATDIRNQGDFFPEIHEDAFDHGIMVAQQLKDESDRTVKMPETIPSSVFNPSIPTSVLETAGAALIVNTGKNGWSLGTSISAFDVARIFTSDSLANLKTLATGAPSVQRFGWASDINQFLFYTGDPGIGDDGWIVLGG